jgi:hypothetical protein
MSTRSFPSRPRRRRPRAWPLPVLALSAALILAGCGGSASTNKSETVTGQGFSFQAPAGWKVVKQGASVAATNGAITRYEVLRFGLEKPYRVARYAAVSRELDGVAARLATQLKGHVTTRSTTVMHGRKSRSYTIEYGGGKTLQIAFVLKDTTEYEVLCRRLTSASASGCAQLFSSFALG